MFIGIGPPGREPPVNATRADHAGNAGRPSRDVPGTLGAPAGDQPAPRPYIGRPPWAATAPQGTVVPFRPGASRAPWGRAGWRAEPMPVRGRALKRVVTRPGARDARGTGTSDPTGPGPGPPPGRGANQSLLRPGPGRPLAGPWSLTASLSRRDAGPEPPPGAPRQTARGPGTAPSLATARLRKSGRGGRGFAGGPAPPRRGPPGTILGPCGSPLGITNPAGIRAWETGRRAGPAAAAPGRRRHVPTLVTRFALPASVRLRGAPAPRRAVLAVPSVCAPWGPPRYRPPRRPRSRRG